MIVSTAATGAQRAAIANDARAGAGTWFHLVVEQDRDHAAPIVWTDRDWGLPGDAPKRAFSVADLHAIVRRLAAYYHARGIVARDPVAVYSAAAIDYYVNYLALTSLGAIPVLINRALPVYSAAVVMERVGVVGAFCDGDSQIALAEAARSGTRIGFRHTAQDLAAAGGARLPAAYPYGHDAIDPVLITHSSGTTGIPKAVPMQHGNFFTGIRYRLRLPVPKPAERVLSALPGIAQLGDHPIHVQPHLRPADPGHVLPGRHGRTGRDRGVQAHHGLGVLHHLRGPERMPPRRSPAGIGGHMVEQRGRRP